jgi:hypothetical protein
MVQDMENMEWKMKDNFMFLRLNLDGQVI